MLDWYGRLGGVGKVIVGVVVCVAVFVVVFFAATAFISQFLQGGNTAQQPPPATVEEAEETTEVYAPTEVVIESAEWAGDVIEVSGELEGDFSSIHCDLLEGEEALAVVDWWDREIPPQIADRSFTQTFAAAEGQEIPVEEADYQVSCAGIFAESAMTFERSPVEGTPPG